MRRVIYSITTENNGTFTHRYESDTLKRTISKNICKSGVCNCIGCRMTSAFYDGKPIFQKEKWVQDKNDEKTIYYIIQLPWDMSITMERFLINDPTLESEFTNCSSDGGFGSPIEELFFKEASMYMSLFSQYKIGEYRVDFAIPDKNIVIEIDGHDFHKTKEQRTNDAKRERYLQKKGFRVVRYTGTEIFNDVANCVRQLIEIVYPDTELVDNPLKTTI